MRIADLCKQGKDFYPSFVRENLRGTIIEDYWELGKIVVADQDDEDSIIDSLGIDSFKRDWDLAVEAVQELE